MRAHTALPGLGDGRQAPVGRAVGAGQAEKKDE
jgi:hypothetical protein